MSTPARRNSDLRRTNEIDVLDHLRRQGPLTRAQLSERTTLSAQALADILHGLEKSGLVTSAEAEPAPGSPRRRGRPELQYTHNADRLSVVAVYVGLRYCEISACDASGRPLTSNVQTTPGWDPDAVLTSVIDTVRGFADRGIVDVDRMIMAVVVHAHVDAATERLTTEDMGWNDVDLRGPLHAALGCSVLIREASRAAAMAEYIDGEHRGCNRLAVLNMGPIVSATLITGGIIDDGFAGLGGTISQCWIPTLGGARRVDDVYGHEAIRRSYEAKTGTAVRWARDVSELAAGGDEAAIEVHREIADGIAYTVTWLIAITSPERFVVTGAVGDFNDGADTIAAIEARLDPRFAGRGRVTRSVLGRQAWLRGGIHAALDAELRTQALSS